jgi:hypothetical protein
MGKRDTTAKARPARRHGKHHGHQGSEHSVPSWMPLPNKEKSITPNTLYNKTALNGLVFVSVTLVMPNRPNITPTLRTCQALS